jgi:hypothetical protein
LAATEQDWRLYHHRVGQYRRERSVRGHVQLQPEQWAARTRRLLRARIAGGRREPHAHADSNTHANTNRYGCPHTNSHSYSNAHANANSYGDSYAHPNTNSYTYTDSDANRYSYIYTCRYSYGNANGHASSNAYTQV